MKLFFSRIKKYAVFFLLFIILLLIGIIAFLSNGQKQIIINTSVPLPTITQDQIATLQITLDPTATITNEITSTQTGEIKSNPFPDGLILLSQFNGNYFSIYSYHPQALRYTQLYFSEWDEVEPALSPDGSKLAYRSNQTGFWDIFIRDLVTGETTNISKSAEYDGSASWSPDSQWLVYETYQDDNFNLIIQSITDLESTPIQLTSDTADDHSPSWSPLGREIAFISNRSGNNDIWLARFDFVENDRFLNLTNSPDRSETHPAYSTSGDSILFSIDEDEGPRIHVLDNKTNKIQTIGRGACAFWKFDDSEILSLIPQPNFFSLAIFDIQHVEQIELLLDFPSTLMGVQWISPDSAIAVMSSFESTTNMIDHSPDSSFTPTMVEARENILRLESVAAPYPFIAASAYQPFTDLRNRIGYRSGWDFLANLESAYTPITAPPDLGLPQNWLYTGKAIAVNTLPIQANWMVLGRENINGQIFWRIWIKALTQDGSLGVPLKDPVWDLDSRFSGNTVAYENGGVSAAPPEGYWVDITELALENDWLRLPALSSWRTYYAAARFNILVYESVDDWTKAMLKIYPPEALATYTPLPTSTPLGLKNKTASPTPSSTKKP